MKLCRVEHFVFTFGRDCYFIQQFAQKLRQICCESVQPDLANIRGASGPLTPMVPASLLRTYYDRKSSIAYFLVFNECFYGKYFQFSD